MRNVSSNATNQHIRIISEGSCDTEDWSNDAENPAFGNELHWKKVQMENSYLKIVIIFHNITVFTVF